MPTLTGDIGTLIGTDYVPGKAHVRLVPSDSVTVVGGQLRLGGWQPTIASDGTFSIPDVPSTSISGTTYKLKVVWSDPGTGLRDDRESGWFSLTADATAEFKWRESTPPIAITAAVAAQVAAAAALGTTNDSMVASFLANSGSATRAAVTANVLADAAPAALGTATVGTSNQAAREDHVHPSNLTTTTVPSVAASTGAVGISGAAARADHVHPTEVTDSVAPAALGASAAVGSASKAARADHVHKVPGKGDAALSVTAGANCTTTNTKAYARGGTATVAVNVDTSAALASGATLFTLTGAAIPSHDMPGTVLNQGASNAGVNIIALATGAVILNQALPTGALLRGQIVVPL